MAELYLRHRLSEDLDFFSDDLYPNEILLHELEHLKKEIGATKVRYIENKNRKQFTIEFRNQKPLKLEFVYFPFGRVKSKQIDSKFGIRIDGIKSIGENKIFALYESAEPKHASDLYWICKKNSDLNFKKLYSGATKKFGTDIDKIVLLEKALEAIDKISKIKPLFFKEFIVSKEEMTEFFRKIKEIR